MSIIINDYTWNKCSVLTKLNDQSFHLAINLDTITNSSGDTC
jgi:hypothetical protein